jgi:hypothetical protein
MNQQLQFFGTQADAGAVARGPAECTFFETLGANPKSTAIPIENTDSVTELIGEQEQMPAENFLVENRLHKSIETVEAESQIYRCKRDKYAGCRRNAQHCLTPASFAMSWTVNCSRQRIVKPDGAMISIFHPVAEALSWDASFTSLNKTGTRTGRFETRFALFNHQLKVAFGTPYC